MGCYHPLVGVFLGYDSYTHKPQYKVNGMSTYDPRYANPLDIMVPCGQCIGCRLDHSRSWADRMILELDHSKSAVFVTLTYDDAHVPIGQFFDDGTVTLSLDKDDPTLFFKRLRYYYPDREIRYYLSGEYGSTTSRPHYHVIIFGLSLDDFPDRKVVGVNEFKQLYYSSPSLNDIWSLGLVCLANVSWATCAYVSRYILKKATGDLALFYAEANILPPYSVMSRRPGIAAYYIRDHPDLFESDYIYFSDPDRKHNKICFPKYFIDSLSATDPDLAATIKEQRSDFARDRLLLELQRTDLDCVAYLTGKESAFVSRSQSILARNKV